MIHNLQSPQIHYSITGPRAAGARAQLGGKGAEAPPPPLSKVKVEKKGKNF